MTGDMKYQKIMKYLVRMVCTQPLHIGSASGDKEEVLVHPTVYRLYRHLVLQGF